MSMHPSFLLLIAVSIMSPSIPSFALAVKKFKLLDTFFIVSMPSSSMGWCKCLPPNELYFSCISNGCSD